MFKNHKVITSLSLIVLFSALVLVACGTKDTGSTSPDPTAVSQPEASEGLSLLQDRCGTCHSASRVESESKSAEQWKTTVERMVNKGAKLNSSEQQILIEYLSQTYP